MLLRATLAAHAGALEDKDGGAAEDDAALLRAVALQAAAATGEPAPPPPARGVPPGASEELRRLVDWRWLAAEVQAPLRLGAPRAVTLVAASPRSLQPARYREQDTLLCQARRGAACCAAPSVP